MQECTEIQKLEYFEMAKVDVIEERLNNHITYFRFALAGILAALSFLAVELYHLNGRLGELNSLNAKVTKVELQSQASLPQPAFDKALPDIRSAVAAARKDSISVPPTVIDGLRSKLLASNSQAPDFWATLSEFVSYRSTLNYHSTVMADFPLTGKFYAFTNQVPNCMDSPPKPMRVKEVLNPQQITNNPGLYENCRFVLDSPTQDQALNAILKGNTPFITFKNCLIEYHGGEISLILAWDKAPFAMTLVGRGPEDPTRVMQTTISGPAIQFENCLFSFMFQNPPPPKGQLLSTTLLAGNTNSMSLPVSP
jgi:hypothetical protein